MMITRLKSAVKQKTKNVLDFISQTNKQTKSFNFPSTVIDEIRHITETNNTLLTSIDGPSKTDGFKFSLRLTVNGLVWLSSYEMFLNFDHQ